MNYTTSQKDLKLCEDTKKHQAAATSIEAFKAVTRSGQRMREKSKVLEAVSLHQPVTSRMISSITGIERSSICRSLYDLIHDSKPQVKEAYTAKCPITNKRVNWYSLVDYPQMKLFSL